MNVIVIMNDSWRIDHLGCYGNKWIKTPNIDKFAQDCAIFDRMYPEGLPTLPVRTSFFTGRYTFSFRGWQRLEPTDVVLAELLMDKNCQTSLVTDCYHFHKPSMAYERGFDYVHYIRGHEADSYITDISNEEIEPEVKKFHKPGPNEDLARRQLAQYLKNRRHWKSEEDNFAAQVVKASIHWLENKDRFDRRKNFFLWVDMFDPHEPWDPMPPYDKMYTDPKYKGQDVIFPIPGPSSYLTDEELKNITKLYAGKCTQTDKWVGVLLDKLREMGLYDDTLIVWTTDHGEPFGEHGIVKKAEPWPYVEEVHMPFMIRHPQGVGKGKRIDGFVQPPDLLPTVMEFMGLKLPPRIHGQSLLPLMKGEKKELRDFAVTGRFKRAWRIMDKEWALIHYFIKRPDELYHVSEDYWEKKNVIDKHPDVAARLELKIRRFAESLK